MKSLFCLFYAVLCYVSLASLAMAEEPLAIEAIPAELQRSTPPLDAANAVGPESFQQNGRRCGTRMVPPSVAMMSKIARSVAHCTSNLTSMQDEYWLEDQVYIIPVWFHVLYRSDNTGYISDTRIDGQIQVLNEDFSAMAGTIGAGSYNTKIQFELAGVTRTLNNNWFDNDDEDAYKPFLRKDPSQYLNIYTTSAGGYLGYAYFPQGSAGQWWDGVVMLHSTIGGRDNGFQQYNQGRSLVHEIGHYLGLYHTFGHSEGSCENSYTGGDLIVDTAAEGLIHYDCVQTVSCGSIDPIHNYMSYTDDLCMNEFTREQANRSICSLVNYRPDAYRVVGDDGSGDESGEGSGDGPDDGWSGDGGGTIILKGFVPSMLIPILLNHPDD